MLGLAAVLFQLAIPLGQGMAFAAYAEANDQAALPPLVICTAMGGTSRIPVDGNTGAPSDQPAPCAFCLIFCQVRSSCENLLPVAAFAVPIPRTVSWVYTVNFKEILVSERLARRHPPRAPPSFT